MSTGTTPLTYSIAEAAARLGVNHQTLRAAVRRGEVPAIRIGPRRTLIPAAWLDQVLAAGELPSRHEGGR